MYLTMIAEGDREQMPEQQDQKKQLMMIHHGEVAAEGETGCHRDLVSVVVLGRHRVRLRGWG